MKSAMLLAVLSLLACGPGSAGPPGPKGEGLVLGSSTYCSVVNKGFFEHQIYAFSDGSLMVTCTVTNPQYSISRTFFYGASQNGALDGFCVVVNDWDGNLTSGYWTFSWNQATSTSTATYHDPGSVQDSMGRTLPCK